MSNNRRAVALGFLGGLIVFAVACVVMSFSSCVAPPKVAAECPKLSGPNYPNYERTIHYPMIPAIKWLQDLIPVDPK